MGNFVIGNGAGVKVFLSENEDSAVKTAVKAFFEDLKKLVNADAMVVSDPETADIIIKTAENNTKDSFPELLDNEGNLIWEAFFVKADSGKLFISGSGRRGTIYGIYSMSEMWGVSPWWWFADVPVRAKKKLEVPEGYSHLDYPSVKYRGIFINDEEELEAWAIAHMNESTIGPKTYARVFELLLRLKANYIWPAMHVNAFNADKENGRLANEMGIVVGTSHCDMLLRSNQNEWKPWVKSKGYEGTEYDYSIEGQNRDRITEYWVESLQQNFGYDVTYTVGMRGIHDSGFVTRAITENQTLSEEEKKQAKIKLLEKVIDDQRELIKKHGNPDALQTFVPYKEVMNLYDAGLKVPEDITLIWANDSFGYMRRYPSKEEQKRSGGHGLYYHVSYWAHPGLSWLFYNSAPLAQAKNELRKSYDNGIRKLWVVNVGAIKPLEIDIEFFLNYAWEINRNETRTGNVTDFIKTFMNSKFENTPGDEAASIYEEFTQIANVCKVEHMKSETFSQTAWGNEAAFRLNRLEALFDRTRALEKTLREDEREIFFEIFAIKIYAAFFIYSAFYFADRSKLMFALGRMREAEEYVEKSRHMEQNKRKVIWYYNKVMCGGKWDKILTPDSFPPPSIAQYPLSKPALVITEEDLEAQFPPVPCRYSQFDDEPLFKSSLGFAENDGIVSMLAAHYDKNTGFREIHNLGRGEGSLLEADGGTAEYRFELKTAGAHLLEFYRFPTLNSVGRIRIGISVDDGEVFTLESKTTDEWRGNWEKGVTSNVEKLTLQLPELSAGVHNLRLHSIDRYVAFSKLVIYTRGFVESNCGPRESYHPVYNTEPSRGVAVFEPDMDALDAFCHSRLQCDTPPLPEVIFCGRDYVNRESVYVRNVIREQEKLGRPIYACNGAEKPGRLIYACNGAGETDRADLPGVGTKNVFEKFGSGVFTEADGKLGFGTEKALENSENAYITGENENELWQHTHSETNGRTGIAMYVPENAQLRKTAEGASALNYRVKLSGGEYRVWFLLKYDDGKAAHCAIAVDGKEIPQEQMFGKGNLFNYSTKQNWVWMLLTDIDVAAGEHIFSIYGIAPGFRVDRVYLTKTDELPPIDCEWTESERR